MNKSNKSDKFIQFMVQTVCGVVMASEKLNIKLTEKHCKFALISYVNTTHRSIVFEDDVYINEVFGEYTHSPDCIANIIFMFGESILNIICERKIVNDEDNFDTKRTKYTKWIDDAFSKLAEEGDLFDHECGGVKKQNFDKQNYKSFFQMV